MILQALDDLYNRLVADPAYCVSPRGFSLQKIVFRVVLHQNGQLLEIQDARVKDASGRDRPRQEQVPGYPKPSGTGLNPGFLWDTSQYMLGYKQDDPNPARTAEAFNAFREKHLKLQAIINSPAFDAVCEFLKCWNPKQAANWSILDKVGSGYGVFQIVGQTSYVHDDPKVKQWWLSTCCDSNPNAVIGQCLITGKTAPIARLHPKIKKVGGQGESLLVSFNDAAYESYGKAQSFNAPVSEEAAFRYTTALNALTDGPQSVKHRFELGDATIVFWTDKPTIVEDIFAEFATGSPSRRVNHAQDEGVRQKLELFLKAIRQGREAFAELNVDAKRTKFYILGLTGQARGRIGVRFFLTDSLEHLLANLHKHLEDVSMVRRFDEHSKRPDPEFPSLAQLLEETAVRRNGKIERESIPPLLEGPLLRAVLAGLTYPDALYTAVMRRCNAERNVTYGKACAIAAWLRRNRKQEISMSLDLNRIDPPYRLGRLFAVLEMAQLKAVPNIKNTIRDSYYSSASTTPMTVFPRLIRLSQHHLAKLEGGNKIYFERLIQEILSAINEFPAHLDLEEQGLFALGYYHQSKDLWTSKQSKSDEK